MLYVASIKGVGKMLLVLATLYIVCPYSNP